MAVNYRLCIVSSWRFLPAAAHAIVYQPDDSFNIVDLLLVTDLEVKPEGGQKSNGRRKRRP